MRGTGSEMRAASNWLVYAQTMSKNVLASKQRNSPALSVRISPPRTMTSATTPSRLILTL